MGTTRDNILFVIIDQLRADVLFGAVGDVVDLPNLRGFAREACDFRRHYSVTNPCGPSRASILTGQYAMNHRATRNGTPLPADTPNFATEIRKAGYLPLLYGYTDSAQDPRARHPGDPDLRTYEAVMPGFAEACEMRLEESWPWRAHLAARGYDVPPYPDIFRPDGPEVDSPALYRAEDSDTAFLTDQAIGAIRARPPGWCLHLTWIRPHPPLVAPAPYNTLVDRGAVPAPAPGLSDHPFDRVARAIKPLSSNVEGFPDLPDTPQTRATLRALYLGLAAEVDFHFGRVLAALRETGQDDKTLIVVTADHGEMLGDHGQWGKMSYHDAAYHVPLMIRDPGRPAGHGRVVDHFTESVDITPTLLDRAGVDIPDTMDGRSLLPFLDGATPDDWREHSFSELDYGDPITPTRWQTDLGLCAQTANLAILRSDRGTYVHFNGGLPPVTQGTCVPDQMARAMLDHRMTHAAGRFARTMITPDGPKRAGRD